MKKLLSCLKAMPLPEIALIIIMALTVLSFFVQSALPTETSAKESDTVSEIIEPVIPSDSSVGQVVHPNIRKIGHFLEFGAFGIEAALFIFFYTRRKPLSLLGFSASALFIALCDETLQIFSGRGPAIADVWIDFFGFFTLCILTLCMAFALHKIIRKK